MKIMYTALPGLASGTLVRPMVTVTMLALSQPVPALLDSGALHNRFDDELALAAGIDTSRGESVQFSIGGQTCIGNVLPVELAIGNTTWEANVTFVKNWPHDHQILGLYGFFDRFKVTFHTAAGYVSLVAN